jgi:hypothetical protein
MPGTTMAADDRKQLETLLKRVAKEPAADWDFTSEGQKTVWLLGRLADIFKAQAQKALEAVKPKKGRGAKPSKVPTFPSSR